MTRWDNFVLHREVFRTHAHTEAERASCLSPRPSFWSTVQRAILFFAADVPGNNQSVRRYYRYYSTEYLAELDQPAMIRVMSCFLRYKFGISHIIINGMYTDTID